MSFLLNAEKGSFRKSGQAGETITPELQPAKIIDFFAARRALFEEARLKGETFDLNQTILRTAGRSSRRVHLPDPLTDALLVLMLAAAVLLAVLAVSGVG
jgi:hypothetical protein